MTHITKLLIVLATVMMVGCSLQSTYRPVDFSAYQYRHRDFDYHYAWNMVRSDQGVALDGAMKNVRYPYVSSILLKVELMGSDGSVKAVEADFPMPQDTREGDVSRFALVLKGATPVSGDLYRFTVHYKGNEGDRLSAVDWISIFTVDAMTGAVVRQK